jgi:hypothetical protein
MREDGLMEVGFRDGRQEWEVFGCLDLALDVGGNSDLGRFVWSLFVQLALRLCRVGVVFGA